MDSTDSTHIHPAPQSHVSSAPETHKPHNKIRYAQFNWIPFQLGGGSNCHQVNGQLVLYADGRGRWTCSTWTDQTHSGDYWNCWFNFKDSRGLLVLQSSDPLSNPLSVGAFKSPRMNDGGVAHTDWSADFAFPADRFDAIAAAASSIQSATC
jgi:hypothetical protein